MASTTFIAIVVSAFLVQAQFDPNGPTQPGLPKGCIGSFPNIPDCLKYNWYLPYTDPCIPPLPHPISGQQVYIKDATNFCINLPDPDSIFLQNNFYNHSKLPTIVQGEGFVRSFCMGDYLPPGSLRLPAGGIRSAHVVQNKDYIQIHGTLDCARLNINCTMSAPGAYDDGGQYDNVGFQTCGKSPYSGVDASAGGNPGMHDYVEMAGNGIFCMRVCIAGTLHGGVCDVLQDTAGCTKLMGVTFEKTGFTYLNNLTGVSTTASVSLPPSGTTRTSTTTTTTSATPTKTASSGSSSTASSGSSSAASSSSGSAGGSTSASTSTSSTIKPIVANGSIPTGISGFVIFLFSLLF
ncbi:hypothetical protein BDR26DRAFT_866077 [Obelidium mucronatum]|nr:hypothetical protein BDR26DRAFT_866077 [Obelidium mucronatum]